MADVPDSITVSDTGFTLPTSEILTGRGFVTGKSGSGKSVLEGTIVYTERGRKPIEDVTAGEQVLSLNKHDYQQEFREVLTTIEHESDELLRITLEDGTEIVGTEDHSFLTVDDLGIVPVRGDELEEGTWFPLARNLPGAETVTEVDLGADSDATAVDGPIGGRSLELDFETGSVLGLYLAGGWVDSRLTTRIPTVDDAISAFLDEWGFTVDGRTCSRTDQSFARFLEATFGGESEGRSLPDWVFDAPATFKAGLLSGYLDGVGAVDETVSVLPESTALAVGIKELLRHFGVSSTVSTDRHRTAERLRIDEASLDRLRAAVELRVAHKAQALERAVDTSVEDGATEPMPGVDHASNDTARRSAVVAGGHWPTGSAQLVPRRHPGRADPDRPADPVVGDRRRARRFGRSDILWKRVVKIEQLQATRTVYDLDVRHNDNFVADGVFVHNSNTASVIAEELLEHGLPLLIVDTDGEYYGLKGRYELLHVGAEADADATISVEHAEKIAELALLQNVPVILDISGFVEEAERRELVRRVVERLFELGKQARKPFLVFVEEIHEFLPQTGKTDDLANTLITVAKRGRKRGIGLCGMSQRPAAVDKDYITQCDWVVWHRLTWDNDKRVASQMLGGDIASGIDDLDTGEGLLMTDWDDRINRIRFRRKRTFDAGATPDLDDIDGGSYSPVSSALLSELSGDDANLNDIDIDELPGAREAPEDAGLESGESPEAADSTDGAVSGGGSASSTLEAAPVEKPGTDVVTIPNRPSSRPSYTPPEPAEDEPFDPVWELGHLTVFLFTRLVGAIGAFVIGLVGFVGRTVRAVAAFGRRLHRDTVRGARWLERTISRDAERAGRTLRQRAVHPTVRELESVAAYGISDRHIAGTVIVLLAIAIILLIVS